MPSLGPKKALVLSAGGFFGAYQAGVWKVLSARFQPQMVVGASAGALNAWAIAGGARPEELAEAWLDPGLSLFDPGSMRAKVEGLWNAYRPRIEIGVVAVELPSLRPRLFRNDEITWRHLAASCAVPLFYPPVRLGEHLYVDGGLTEVVPLWAAAEMGAGEAFAIDVLGHAPLSPMRAAMRAARVLMPRPPRPAAGLQVRWIVPSLDLGPVRKAFFWDREAVLRWIALGRSDAERIGTP